VLQVHGNTSEKCTANNAARCLVAFGAPQHVHVYPGSSKPLLGAPKYAPEIHGTDGLGGVEGLPDVDDHEVQTRFALDNDGNPVRAIEGMAHHIRETWNKGAGSKVTIVSTGPTTNIGTKTLLRCANDDFKKTTHHSVQSTVYQRLPRPHRRCRRACIYGRCCGSRESHTCRRSV
jgi:inosine-uridine nucleoside N-ribohydrolase